jgi:hypothetical protein
VGNNGETLVADSSTSTGLRYTAGTVQANPILNAACEIAQRGTTALASNAATNQFMTDRWQVFRAVAGATFSRQNTNDTTNLPNIRYCVRVARDSGNTATNVILTYQNVETVNTIPFAGKTVTMSFYARAGANYSPGASALEVRLVTGTGTDQNYINGYTGQATPLTGSVVLTTTWQRFTVTGTIAATATEMAVVAFSNPSGTAGANDYYEITGWQIDIGSVALPFRTYAGTFQGELSACQRYYQKSYNQDVTVPTNSAAPGVVYSVSGNVPNANIVSRVNFPVTMRTSPTVTIYSYATSQTSRVSDAGASDLGANSGNSLGAGMNGFSVQNNSGGTLTASYNGFMFHYAASAEL